MTKAEIISFVKNSLKKIDETMQYHPVVIEKAITMAFNNGFSDVFMVNPQELDEYTKSYGDTAGTNITATLNSVTGLYESTIPQVYVPIPDKASGVRHVFTLAYGTTKFYPMTKSELDMATSTLFGELKGSGYRIGYCVRGTKVEFYGMTSTIATAGVRMDLLIPFDKYSKTDEIKIPFSQDHKLIQAVIESLRAVPVPDLKDDNV